MRVEDLSVCPPALFTFFCTVTLSLAFQQRKRFHQLLLHKEKEKSFSGLSCLKVQRLLFSQSGSYGASWLQYHYLLLSIHFRHRLSDQSLIQTCSLSPLVLQSLLYFGHFPFSQRCNDTSVWLDNAVVRVP